MTGHDAWAIVAPILSAHMNNIPHDGKGEYRLNLLDEAYVVTCGALLNLDKEVNDGNTDTRYGDAKKM